jgi:hypothetical protein
VSHPRRLSDCQQVSVCDLTGIERFVVWAIRWRASEHGADGFAAACLQDSFEQAGLRSAQPAFEGFMQIACATPLDCPAWQRLGCWRLNSLEAHALHAIACLQGGLLGEAWATLSRMCSTCHAGRALQYLEILADSLQNVGGRIGRWQAEGMPAASSQAPA